MPQKNLVKNIGFTGEHTSKKTDVHNRKIADDFKVSKHPEFVVPNRSYDLYHFKNFVARKKPLFYRLMNRFRKLFM